MADRTSSEPPAAGPRGIDLRVDVQLTLEEAAAGCSREVTISRRDPCDSCKGTGRSTVASAVRCNICAGAGGTARVERKEISFPAGIASGQTLRLLGKGDAAYGGSPGHLYVVVDVLEHRRLVRRGDDLIFELEVSPALAASGGPVSVPLLTGERAVDIPAGARTGEEIVLRGWGIQNVGAPATPMPAEVGGAYREPDLSGRGNLIVRLRIAPRGLVAWLRRLAGR